MAIESNDGSGLNLPGRSANTISKPRLVTQQTRPKNSGGGSKNVKSFDRSPNPADVSGLGNTTRIPGPTSPVSDDDALSENNLKIFFGSVFNASDTTRRPRYLVWQDCWDIYNGNYDWSGKQWWQSTANIPKVRSSVDRATAVFRRSLLRLRRFYNIAADTKQGKLKGQYTSALLDYWLDQENTLEELVTGMKVGLITSTIVMKVWWQQVREEVPTIVTKQKPLTKFGVEVGFEDYQDIEFKLKSKGKFASRAVDPFNFWIVPETNKFACIERTYATYDELVALAEAGVYDKDAVERCFNLGNASGTFSKGQEARRADELPTTGSPYTRQQELYHYWGDIYNQQGRIVMPNARFTLVNKEILIGVAKPNPLFHKRPPYIVGSPYLVPFSTYHRGMVEDVYQIAKSITELSNLIFDGAMFDALKAFAIDIDGLDNPSEADNGIYPGKTFIKKSTQMPPGSKLIETIDVGKVPQEAVGALNMFKSYYQEGTFINEWVGGEGGKSGRTLGEVNIKTQAAMEGLDESARNIEISVIEPWLDLCSKTIYQFHSDFMIPRLADEFPSVSSYLQSISNKERYVEMMGEYSFKARGLSVLIDQQQRLGEIMNFLTTLSHIPGLLDWLRPSELLEALMMPLNWNVEKIMKTPEEYQMEQMRMMMQQAMMAQGGGGKGPQPGQRQLNPAQQKNAQEGRQMGGRTNNPMAGSKTGPQAGGGEGQGGLLQLIQSAQQGGR